MNICEHDDGYMTKMAAMPIYIYMIKPFKHLFRNRRADFQEMWNEASGTPVHHSLFK